MAFKLTSCIAAILSLSALAACNFTVSNGLVAEHDADIEAYAATVYDAFYDNNLDYIIENGDPTVDGFTKDRFQIVMRLRSEDANVSKRSIGNRASQTINGQKYFVTTFHTPSDGLREELKVTLRKDGEKCCLISGVYLNVNMDGN